MMQDASTFNEPLTILAQGFMAQRKDTLIDFVAPFVPTGTADGDYKYFDQDDPFQLYDTAIPEEGTSKTVHFNATTKQFNCNPHGLKIPLTDWERKKAGAKGYEILRQGKLNTLLSTQLVNREHAGWAKIFAAVAAESGKGAWTGSAGASKDPIDEMDELIEKINNATGSMPTAIVLGLTAWRILKNHPRIRTIVSGIEKRVALEDIRGALLNPEIDIRVGSMPYKPSKLGKGAAKKGIIGSDILIFHRSDSPSTDDMSAFKTFSIDGGASPEVHTLEDTINHKTYDEVMWSEDLRVTAPIAVSRITVI